jgi:MFS family permease
MEHPHGRSRTATAGDQRALKLGCFVLWLGLVLLLDVHHAFWRDEVRALSLALQGNGVVDMLKGIRGEGHPATWYLLLRAAHILVGSSMVLPIVSVGVASAAMLLLVLRSPFNAWMIALLLMGKFALFEYSVMARNYGISVLFMFLLAEFYPRHRDRGFLLGVLLFLLANTNAHSVPLTGAFLLFWLIDLVIEQGGRWTPALRTFLLNAVIAAVGVAVCCVTIYPPFNDAAVTDLHELSLKLLAEATMLPSSSFSELVFNAPRRAFDLLPLLHAPVLALTSVVLFGSMLGLIRLPGAFIATLAALVAFSLFFVVIYPGFYRHQALWLIFLVTLYWIMLARGGAAPLVFGRFTRFVAPLSAVGSVLMVVLLALQVPSALREVIDVALDRPPLSRTRDFTAFVLAHPDLQRAIIIGDPDYLVETLPYYIANRTYFLHEQRFGNVVKFTMHARLVLNLEDILATARTLRAESGQPVLILLAQKLDPSAPAQNYVNGYHWELRTSSEQVSEFLKATHLIASFSPAKTDESYDVYELNPGL